MRASLTLAVYLQMRSSPQVVAWRSATRQWWDNYRQNYELVTSHFVFAELARAPERKANRARALLDNIELLDEPPGLQEVVEQYIEHRLMPAEAGGDAVHLALASLHSIDFLLTWNCRHLANANKV